MCMRKFHNETLKYIFYTSLEVIIAEMEGSRIIDNGPIRL